MGFNLFSRASGVSLVTVLVFAGASGCNDTGFAKAVPQLLTTIAPLPPPNSTLCVTNPQAYACDRTPVVSTPGVVTVLFTLSQIPKSSATLILANAIKYASPIVNPRILFLKDSATGGEDEGDVDYIKNDLLLGYTVEYRALTAGGLRPADVGARDLIIVSNPGHPLSDAQTLTTLQGFAGGVILIGDDMLQGAGFSMAAFTGLTYQSNGTSMSCNGNTYSYDNLNGYSYQVSMNTNFLPGIPDADKNYSYGNDIDIGVAAAGVQVLATSAAAPGTCPVSGIPTVVRRPR